jgi:phosphoribosyl 1,2-cyclic phosphodiesterase
MEVFFLCGGGGRVVVNNQLMATGGFRINFADGKGLHVDPGPGALLKSLKHKQEPRKLEGIFISHEHLDHYNDAHVMIDAMTFGTKGKKGFVIGAESVINGVQGFEPIILNYFKGLVKECRALHAGEEFSWNGKKLVAANAVHEDPSAIGFVLDAEGTRIGYTGDTEYFDGLEKQYEACDLLVINCLRPDDARFEFQLSLDEVAGFVNGMKKKPKTIFLSHLGMKFLQAGKEAQRRKLEEKTGVETRIAEEGARIELGKKTLKDFS